MPAPDAASLPLWDGRSDTDPVVDLDELRVALRPPELPLPRPRTLAEAAARVNDLISAERLGEARHVAATFPADKASPRERAAMARARLRCAEAMGDAEQFAQAARDLCRLLQQHGFEQQALAAADALSQRGPTGRSPRQPGPDRERRPGTTGSRRARHCAQWEVSPAMTAVVRGMATPPPGYRVDPRREARVLAAAMEALPAVEASLLDSPRLLFTVRSAQMLEGAGDLPGATSAALDALALAEQARDGGDEVAVREAERAATMAHAVLARTLRADRPRLAAMHAVEALLTLRHVDDPPLRIGLITDLLHAVMAAGLTDHASFTAGRLISLQRTLRRDALRVAPLLAVAVQRREAGRWDAALVPLEQARQIAREQRDHWALLETARITASVLEPAGRHEEAMVELRRVAAEACRLADDLATPEHSRPVLVRDELDAQALLLRRCLERDDRRGAEAAAGAIVRRTRPDGARPLLPASQIWDRRVDACVGRFLAAALPEPGDAERVDGDLETRRRQALAAIGEVPAGHEDRARYWGAYVGDRYAAILAEQGQGRRAVRAARRALSAWEELGRAEDAERMRELIAQLETGRDGASGQ